MPFPDHRRPLARRSLLAAGLAGGGLLACPPARAEAATLRLAQHKHRRVDRVFARARGTKKT